MNLSSVLIKQNIRYSFVRSKRKTIGITVKTDGSVVLRAPLSCSKKRAEEFLLKNLDWIDKTRKRLLAEKKESEQVPPFSASELSHYRKQALSIIPPLVESTAREMGVNYGRITIRAQKTRWGSCSSKGNLNFNCLLILLPDNLRRYVIVHELCHLKEMNHSKKFWADVARFQPTYLTDRKQLREEGSSLIERIP